MLFLAWLAGWTPSGGAGPVDAVRAAAAADPADDDARCCATVRGFGEPRELNLVLKGTARLSLAFSLLFALGLALSGFVPGGGS